MTCYHPLKAYRSREKTESGKRRLSFNPHKSHVEGSSISVPCGQCIGCRIERSKMWALRCIHEARMHPANSLVTLTYNNQNVPRDYSVKLRDFQLFMKRLRKSVEPKKIRFFACGEYGDNGLRPHYHALLFNHVFHDQKFNFKQNGNDHFTSEALDKLWPFGLNDVTAVTYKSAAYVARYIMKKYKGDKPDDHYTRLSPIDGEYHRVEPEFCVGSRRPGLGTSWFNKFKSDAFPSDFLIVDGRKHAVPKFYLEKLKEDEKEKIKRTRKRKSLARRADHTKERLAVREEIQQARVKRLKRQL